LAVLVVLIATVAAALVFEMHPSGLTVNTFQVPNDLGTGSVASCIVNGSSVAVAGQLQHGVGSEPLVGLVTAQIVDSSGNVLGSVNPRTIGPPFTSGSVNWTVRVRYSGLPTACAVSTQVTPPSDASP
jgi:hypothetical protein